MLDTVREADYTCPLSVYVLLVVSILDGCEKGCLCTTDSPPAHPMYYQQCQCWMGVKKGVPVNDPPPPPTKKKKICLALFNCFVKHGVHLAHIFINISQSGSLSPTWVSGSFSQSWICFISNGVFNNKSFTSVTFKVYL